MKYMRLDRGTTARWLALACLIASAPSAHAFLMWKAERDGKSITLLARVELLSTDPAPLAKPAIQQAFDEADVAVFEAQMDPAQRKQERKRIADSAFYPKGDNLLNHLTPETATTLKTVCEQFGIDSAGMAKVRPWAAAHNLRRLVAAKAGAENPDFMDEYFHEQAIKAGKGVDYLRKPEEIVAFYGSLPNAVQGDLFRKQVDEAHRAKEWIGDADAAWRSGDAARAVELVESAYQPYPGLREAAVAPAAKTWAERLDGMTKFDERIFVVAPADHVVGPGGMIEHLQTLGFSVAPVANE